MTEKIIRASKIGFPCDRNLWYSVNHYEEKTSKKSQRIFDIGTALEPVIINWLIDDGWKVDYNQGSLNAEKELFINVNGGKIAGHYDAIMTKNLFDPLIMIDIKTMNERAFKLWKNSGTLEKYPQYVDQLHTYTKAWNDTASNAGSQTRINTLAIVGVNKNNSVMHIDFFDYDEARTQEIIKRAERIFKSDQAPEPGERLQDWSCNYCGYSGVCNFQEKENTINHEELKLMEEF